MVRYTVSQKGDVTVVELLDEEILDDSSIGEIADLLFFLVQDNSPVQMLLDFSCVKHISSLMLATLVKLNKSTIEGGGSLKLCCINPILYTVFEITQLYRGLSIYEDEQMALESFNK